MIGTIIGILLVVIESAVGIYLIVTGKHPLLGYTGLVLATVTGICTYIIWDIEKTLKKENV